MRNNSFLADASRGGSSRTIRLLRGLASIMSSQAPLPEADEVEQDRNHNNEALNTWLRLTEATAVLLDPKVRSSFNLAIDFLLWWPCELHIPDVAERNGNVLLVSHESISFFCTHDFLL